LQGATPGITEGNPFPSANPPSGSKPLGGGIEFGLRAEARPCPSGRAGRSPKSPELKLGVPKDFPVKALTFAKPRQRFYTLTVVW